MFRNRVFCANKTLSKIDFISYFCMHLSSIHDRFNYKLKVSDDTQHTKHRLKKLLR